MILKKIQSETPANDAIYVYGTNNEILFIIKRDGSFDQITHETLVQSTLRLAIDLMENFNIYFDSLI